MEAAKLGKSEAGKARLWTLELRIHLSLSMFDPYSLFLFCSCSCQTCSCKGVKISDWVRIQCRWFELTSANPPAAGSEGAIVTQQDMEA